MGLALCCESFHFLEEEDYVDANQEYLATAIVVPTLQVQVRHPAVDSLASRTDRVLCFVSARKTGNLSWE